MFDPTIAICGDNTICSTKPPYGTKIQDRVRVQHADEFPSTQRHPDIGPPAKVKVCVQGLQRHVAVLFANDLHGSVAGMVVDDNDLNIRVILFCDGVETAAEVPFTYCMRPAGNSREGPFPWSSRPAWAQQRRGTESPPAESVCSAAPRRWLMAPSMRGT